MAVIALTTFPPLACLLPECSYVFGYYLPEEDKQQKILFEHHQENLEKFTETLR